ncbi:endonuclease/exonuclease/phosphatase family protein [Aestuariibacter sp. AA17]|uniref:Endonuclease/exonuclease/phosphatase family protein n=1 Tax=Fluctibacter corallii TaxID=2984329 RepID=A0ABT3A8T9_9ALTE|nr:endonuclease/exonuclease/phosphatase family protein [Aestuariibacter sp. AA17]MCV2885104.1 endonuclease/exonuclease/phosphatase family protein [Aestuariibacter sp. AA17]
MFIVLSVATLFVLMATVLPLFNKQVWWIRAFDFPRVQFAALSFIILLVSLFTLPLLHQDTWLLLGIHVVCIAYQLSWILPYTLIAKPEVNALSDTDTPDAEITIITANVLMTNSDPKPLLSHIAHYRPDILVTLETDKKWEKYLHCIEDDYPYSVKCPLDNLYGMHLYSKLPLNNASLKFLVEDDVPSIHTSVALPSGVLLQLHCMHPAPPSPTENDESTERDIELILLAKQLKDDDSPIIVTGDLNDVAWSKSTRLFRQISRLLDPRVGRGMFNTFHANHWFARWPLDHLFHSQHFKIKQVKRLSNIGSDHFPLMTKLAFFINPDNNQQNELPDAEEPEWLRKQREKRNITTHDVPDPTD